MNLSEEDRRKLIEAMDKKSVEHWMNALEEEFKKYGEVGDEGKTFYLSYLKQALKVKDSPRLTEIRNGYILVETEDMKIEILNENIQVSPINKVY